MMADGKIELTVLEHRIFFKAFGRNKKQFLFLASHLVERLGNIDVDVSPAVALNGILFFGTTHNSG